MVNDIEWKTYGGPGDVPAADTPNPDGEPADVLDDFSPAPAGISSAAVRAVLNGLIAFKRIAVDTQEGFQLLAELFGKPLSVTDAVIASNKHGYSPAVEAPDRNDVLAHVLSRPIVVGTDVAVFTILGINDDDNMVAITASGVMFDMTEEELDDYLETEGAEILLV